MSNKVELLRRAKERVDAILAERKRQQKESEADEEALELAVRMQMNDAIVDAVRETKIEPESFADVFKNAVQTIKIDVPDVVIPPITVPEARVTIPEIKIPEIKLPTINVPKPEVTVNVPPQPAPVLQA